MMLVVLLVALVAFVVGVFAGVMLLAWVVVDAKRRQRKDAREGRLRVHNGGRR